MISIRLGMQLHTGLLSTYNCFIVSQRLLTFVGARSQDRFFARLPFWWSRVEEIWDFVCKRCIFQGHSELVIVFRVVRLTARIGLAGDVCILVPQD
jgi:hypothetical protein